VCALVNIIVPILISCFCALFYGCIRFNLKGRLVKDIYVGNSLCYFGNFSVSLKLFQNEANFKFHCTLSKSPNCQGNSIVSRPAYRWAIGMALMGRWANRKRRRCLVCPTAHSFPPLPRICIAEGFFTLYSSFLFLWEVAKVLTCVCQATGSFPGPSGKWHVGEIAQVIERLDWFGFWL
jgi:hypothetical protein